MISRLTAPVANPAATAATPTHAGNANGRRRQDRRCDRCGEKQRCREKRRLALDGEIDDGAAAEADREPRHQPTGSGLDRCPFANALRHPAREIGEALRPRARAYALPQSKAATPRLVRAICPARPSRGPRHG